MTEAEKRAKKEKLLREIAIELKQLSERDQDRAKSMERTACGAE